MFSSAVAVRADVLFGVEQPNEQQAEVRNVAPTALPSDYHTKTYLCVCVCVYLSVCTSVYVSLTSHCCKKILALCIANTNARSHTHTHTNKHAESQKGTSVMRSKESKSKGPLHWTLTGVKTERRKGGQEGSEVGRDEEKKKGRWKAGAGVLRPPGNL